VLFCKAWFSRENRRNARAPPLNVSLLRFQVNPDTASAELYLESATTHETFVSGTAASWDLSRTADNFMAPSGDCVISTIYPSSPILCEESGVTKGCEEPLPNPLFDVFADGSHLIGECLENYDTSIESPCGEVRYPPHRTFLGASFDRCPGGQELFQLAMTACTYSQQAHVDGK
jgi:hypothetical protein